ncbi:MAG: neutral/alkaline non-lysosomal ceramidase N-terminal domain-containing protein [Cyclobacteriaceae bacterium]
MKKNQESTIVNFQAEGLMIRSFLLMASILLLTNISFAQHQGMADGMMEVGVARIDITPEGPIRLAGYGVRKKTESEGVLQRLGAKALALGNDAQGASILITVDLVGIPLHITTKLAERLSRKVGVKAEQLVICASHTHSGPEVGNLLNILQYRKENAFSDSLLALEHLLHISQYIDQLSQKLEQVSLEAMKNRRPALVAWGQGQAMFAKNRRSTGGPVDVALPILRVTDPNGKLRAVLVNYACHGTTLPGEVNKIHGDWMGEAQKIIEANHPDALAMIAIGCGADANPQPRGTMENAETHGREISDNVEKLLTAQLQPLTTPPVGRIKWVKLPFANIPTVPELIKQTDDKTVKGYYARLALDHIARGQVIPLHLNYPVQTWTFGKELVMINLAGEVVVDYATRLKNEIGAERVWVNAYANDVPCYIASRRVIKEGGYEAESSMYFYNKPSPFVEEVEDIVVKAVHDLLPEAYKDVRALSNNPEVVHSEIGDVITLRAEVARSIGPEIKYMPEWKAFGWFTEADRVEWDVEVKDKSKYDVYLDWSVSDSEAGKPFVFEAGDQKLTGKIGKSGSWFTYRNEKIGRIRLSAGSHTLVFKAGSGSSKGALLDLRSLKLVPVK